MGMTHQLRVAYPVPPGVLEPGPGWPGQVVQIRLKAIEKRQRRCGQFPRVPGDGPGHPLDDHKLYSLLIVVVLLSLPFRRNTPPWQGTQGCEGGRKIHGGREGGSGRDCEEQQN